MHPKYPNMFSPIKLGPVEIPNRFYFAPHGIALTVGSKPSNDCIAYCVERVKEGGAGLVVISLTAHERGRIFQPSPYLAENIPAFRALADAVHAAGGKIFGEIWYHWCAQGHWDLFSPPAPMLSASTAQFGLSDRTASTHAMDTSEIRAMTEVFAQSTRHLREAGFDGVMIHASHAGLMEQFLSPYYNRRTDAYGGCLENRMRFLKETLRAARAAAQGEIAVGMRFNCDELVQGGYTTEDSSEVLGLLCGAGLLDFVDLDVAMEPQQLELGMPPVFIAPQIYRPYVEKLRKAAGAVPVMSVLGRLTSIADGEAALAAGICDMVGAARALIAEPELVRNARDGREDRSRICIACNWCLSALGDGAQGCTLNPASYRERHWGVDTFAHAPRQSRVVVVGGGPGGLEAARVSALRGHRVTLLEARAALGGGLALWATLPGREAFQAGVEWWARALERLGVEIRLGTEASSASVRAENPDAVIIATGARYSPGGRTAFLDRDIPGHDLDFVYRPEDILVTGLRPTGNIVLLDGEGQHASLGIAEILGKAGARVTYLTAGYTPISARLADSQETRFVMKRLRAAGVTFSPSTAIRRIGDQQVTLHDVYTDEERTIDVDAVILVTGREPLNSLAVELEGKIPQLYTVGDALAARPWATAAYEGQKFARYIGEPGAPKTVGEAYFRLNGPDMVPRPAG